MEISQLLDATYLKTARQANLTEEENEQKVIDLINEAILYDYKLIMIRAKYILLAKKMLQKAKSKTLVGTVIAFHEGTASLKEKLQEAQKAIDLGADELDFVINYTVFIEGNLSFIKEEVTACTKICLINNKVIKWIIEVASLKNNEIIVVSQLI
jgi:deoxyribose-phosphate aldolase